MNVTELCNSQRDKLLSQWTEGFFSSYPLSGTGFLRTGTDPFTNPVGMATRASLAVLYDAVAGKVVEPADLRQSLTRLMEIRAVQDMPPSHAVGALYLLKKLLREHVLPAFSGQGAPALEYLEAESRVDSLTMLAFDLYLHQREKVFAARVEDVKRGQAQILRWAQKRRGEVAPADQTGYPGDARAVPEERAGDPLGKPKSEV